MGTQLRAKSGREKESGRERVTAAHGLLLGVGCNLSLSRQLCRKLNNVWDVLGYSFCTCVALMRLSLSKVTPKLLKITYQRVLKLSLSTSAITQNNSCSHAYLIYIVYTIYIYKSSWKVFALCFCFRLPNQELTYINNKFNFGCNRKKDNNKNKNTWKK